MIRLGRISYVNMAPVFYRVDAEVDEVRACVSSEAAHWMKSHVAWRAFSGSAALIGIAQFQIEVTLTPRRSPPSNTRATRPGFACCLGSVSPRRAPWTRSSS